MYVESLDMASRFIVIEGKGLDNKKLGAWVKQQLNENFEKQVTTLKEISQLVIAMNLKYNQLVQGCKDEMSTRGGYCRFAMESKSFNLSVEVVGRNLRGVIEARGKGLSTWIRFGDLGLRYLLEGVEHCCRDEDLVRWSQAWEEVHVGAEGLLRGWSILAKKLHILGVISSNEFRGVVSLSKERSFQNERLVNETYAEVVRKVPSMVGDAIWLQLGGSEVKSREEQLRKCLIEWLRKILVFGGTLFLLNLEDNSKAKRVLERGTRRLKDKVLHLVRWTPKASYSRSHRLKVGGDVEGDTRVEVGVGKEGPSQQLASVDMLQQCDKAALTGAKSLSGSEASEAHSDSINEVEDDLRVGQAQGLLKGMVFSINFKEMTQYSCIEDRGVWLEVVLVSISASSYVAFIDKALVAKANSI
ncbi:hypothetical protein CK203_018536 [Vitis vinifera]|uniref:DUF4283 domain-containing protein n=1 Tax=Vitis vinifera TaxID=29760 RepID=A0A438J626_VITVI|nr:hypothetical protein CK203_018536 [Vitis vinifera]